ncbi:uncharacterized protein LOC113637428 isoform X2 [Tachysurus ichikawai]
MTNQRMLKELTDLKNSRFGRPYPRHGLKLLYWFANEFMFFNNNNKMCCQYNPKNSFYGFHRFNNRRDKNGVKLLPDANLRYYVVGYLNSEGADKLPDYVREDYGGFKNGNNMDRIIVCVDDQFIESVYVTEHSDRTDFDKEATFFISKELLMIIREMTLEEFLSKCRYSRPGLDYGQKTGVSRPQVSTVHSSVEEEINSFWDDNETTKCCRCVIL